MLTMKILIRKTPEFRRELKPHESGDRGNQEVWQSELSEQGRAGNRCFRQEGREGIGMQTTKHCVSEKEKVMF